MIDYAILSGIVLLSLYGAYRGSRFSTKITHITESKLEPICEDNAQQSNKIKESKVEPIIYQLQIHKVKYWIYTPSYSLSTCLTVLYNDIVIKNLWLHEPFHTKFYEILMILDHNELMIIDPRSKVMTLNVRGKDNQLTATKSFQVFATKDILEATLRNAMSEIVQFHQHDAQQIVIAICVFTLEKSLHYQSDEVSIDATQNVLRDYAYIENIYYIRGILERKDEKLQFVDKAFKLALRTSPTHPYNDSEVLRPLQIPTILPLKALKEV